MRELTCSEIAERALIGRYVVGQLSDDDVEVLESHYLTCARCFDELRLAVGIRETLPDVAKIDMRRLHILESASGDGREAAAASQDRSPPTGRRLGRRAKVGTAAALAAAAVIAGLLFLRPAQLTDELAPTHRDDVPTAESRLMPQAPVGEVAAAREFRWSPLTAADRYRVTLYDAMGTALWEAETSETSAVLPEEIRLVPGASYLWEVAARVDWNRWIRSDVVRFEIHER
ncbi:MAG: hypothetical protein GWN99_00795 [Gemmatimonadetes bacterium]|uniref:Zinc-finger domain-containing protein n=1 Tax=Candidatus Kutchimonas denitrificans TaxID=3056748 RepID=A0AAE4Z8Y3_9BACT|nr:hypothetical protein [Gemmatimonadota bacterium]NIR73646.1 hypothetical protein [Candidatus Kutchimonas denitrificans]NIR99605.1 hypothetical protein [Gemmatimonadota bacterium]NIT65225.1 hypothetical protein [Gemmatimonadota bacterium]NIV23758.1 hypothetical protein [Gemmatimonadota bacterium]